MLHWNGNIDWSDLSNISYLSISRFEDTCVSVDLGTILGTQFRVTSSTVEVRLVHQDWGRIQLLGASGALETSFVESFPSSWESLGIIDVFVTLGTFLPLQILYISWHPAPAPDSWLVQVPLTPCILTPGLLSSCPLGFLPRSTTAKYTGMFSPYPHPNIWDYVDWKNINMKVSIIISKDGILFNLFLQMSNAQKRLFSIKTLIYSKC